jgi:hypothetical protein
MPREMRNGASSALDSKVACTTGLGAHAVAFRVSMSDAKVTDARRRETRRRWRSAGIEENSH